MAGIGDRSRRRYRRTRRCVIPYSGDGDAAADLAFYKFKDIYLSVRDSMPLPTNDYDDLARGDYDNDSETPPDEPIIFWDGVEVPDYVDVTAVTPENTGAYRWITVTAEVDTAAILAGTSGAAGTVTIKMTDAATGGELLVGTLDASLGEQGIDPPISPEMSRSSTLIFSRRLP